MDFTRKWTPFAIAAELEHFGEHRMVYAHNEAIRIRDEDNERLAKDKESLIRRIDELEKAFRHVCNAATSTTGENCGTCGLNWRDPVHHVHKDQK